MHWIRIEKVSSVCKRGRFRTRGKKLILFLQGMIRGTNKDYLMRWIRTKKVKANITPVELYELSL